MLQRALAERVGLKFHMTPREIPIYVLIAAKKGFTLRPLPESAEKPPLYYSGYPDRFEGTGTLDAFALYFRSYSDAPVINKTAIPGTYHLEFRWARDPDGDYKDQFWAELERAAGLRRERRKLPCDVLVVDQALRVPTPN